MLPTTQWWDLPPTPVFAYGTNKDTATVPGPTIEALHGIDTYVTWQNHLPPNHILPWDPTIPTAIPHTKKGIPTVVHVHGSISEPESDGHAGVMPGNLWYHDHAMGLTRVNLLAGLIGAYIIRHPEIEVPLGLPCGNAFDRPLIIFDRSFCTDGSLYMNSTGNNPSIHPQWQPEYFGDAIIVNGKAWPRMIVRRRKYRFRIINASNARFFKFFFMSGLRFIHVASDSVYLERPVTLKEILLAPSEIADVIVDFSESKSHSAILANDAPYPYPSVPISRFIQCFGHTVHRDVRVHTSDIGEPTHLYLNGKSYDEPATETPKVGTTEVWDVINLTEDNHPLHVHLGLFVVLDQTQLVDIEEFKDCMTKMNDAIKCQISKYARGKKLQVLAHEKGWKNVYKMTPGFVTKILVRFSYIHSNASYAFDATKEPGYVYHCHVLNAAMLYWPMPNVLYVEGYALDRFAEGACGHYSQCIKTQCPSSSFQFFALLADIYRWLVGLVLDAGIEEEIRVRHLQVVDATRASLGLPVIEYAVTDTPLQISINLLNGKKPEDMKDADWTVLDRKALGTIRLTLSSSVAFNISKEKTTSGLMAALSKMYEKPSASNKVYLMKRLFNMKMANDGRVAEHLNNFNTVTSQLNNSSGSSKFKVRRGGHNSQRRIMQKIQRGCRDVRKCFEYKTREISQSRKQQRSLKIKVGEIQGSTREKDAECYNCEKKGHFAKYCKSPKKQTDDQRCKNSVNVSDNGDSEALVLSVATYDDVWIVDLGASFHATYQKEILHNYVKGDFGKVYLGDDEPCSIIGKGEVQISLTYGTTLHLKDVRHVPNLKRNLISVGQLATSGCKTIFTDDSWKVTKGAMVMAHGKK
ncbi:cupredoxin superfamily protein [Actinidia rufa]|uniref:Cupredoxin superfamily protein n=1 Tax=Actinidia rufa TaxID=165716 RepID=A0A7J0GYP9_9ERIC|nr:cupredoxin superfamily protein [Actinidia rufa]